MKVSGLLGSLYAQALKDHENVVTVYGPNYSVNTAAWTAFDHEFPKIRVEGSSIYGASFESRVGAEFRTRHYVGDVYLLDPPTTALALKEHWVASYVPPNFAKYPNNSPFVQTRIGDKVYAAQLIVDGFIVNHEVPKSMDTWAQLLQPQWKGKIVVADPAVPGASAFVFANMLWDGRYTSTYFRALAKQKPFLIPSLAEMPEDVASGEYPVGIAASAPFALTAIAKGLPVRFVLPADGTQVSAEYIMLAKHAPQPAAAKLLINWLLTSKVQTLLNEATGSYSLLASAPPAKGFPLLSSLPKGGFLKSFPLNAQISEMDIELKMAKKIFG
jgi:iron(III) transport system substrate-binding protein